MQDNKTLWDYIGNLDEQEAHRVSRRIVDFALTHGATILVLEHLGRFRPQKGSYSRRGNEKRAYWLRGKIYRYAHYKAWAAGIVTTRVNPRHTSRDCHRCGSLVARFGEGEMPTTYRPGAPLVYCWACRMRDDADHNAARNIGQRLIARTRDKLQPKRSQAEKLSAPASTEQGGSKESGVTLSYTAGSHAGSTPKGARQGEGGGRGTASCAVGV